MFKYCERGPQRFVGADRERVARRYQGGEGGAHIRIGRRQIDGLLIFHLKRGEQLLGERPCRIFAQSRDHLRHQMTDAAPDEAADLREAERIKPMRHQHAVHAGMNIGRAVDQRSVEIEDHGGAGCALVGLHHACARAASAAARIARIFSP